MQNKSYYDKLGKMPTKQLKVALKTKSGIRRNPSVADIRAAISEQDITGCYSHRQHRSIS